MRFLLPLLSLVAGSLCQATNSESRARIPWIVIPNIRKNVGDALGGAYPIPTEGKNIECRLWDKDPYIGTVVNLLKTTKERYLAIWKEELKKVTGPVDNTKFKAAYKSDFDAGVIKAKVPARLCNSIPPEVLAYDLTIVEGCFAHNTQITMPAFAVPTPFSECKMKVVQRFFRDSNGDLPGGAIPKGIVVESLYDKTLHVVFRATDNDSNWLSVDFKFTQVPFMVDGKSRGKVHKGFFTAFDLLDRDFGIIKTVKEYAKKGFKISFSGLSMGGALATVGALSAKLQLGPGTPVNVVTFGSPRVFDEATAALFDKEIGTHLRGVAACKCNGNEITDIVTTVPPKNGQDMDDRRASMLETMGERQSIKGDSLLQVRSKARWPDWADKLKERIKADMTRAKNAVVTGATDGAKDGVFALAALAYKYKHVKAPIFYEVPTMPLACPNKYEFNRLGVAAHGMYRAAVEVRLANWLQRQSK